MTLGHNSSVIFYDCENNPIGYEEERLTGIKSDSTYPINAFNKVIYNLTEEQLQGANIFISHWFDTFDVESFPSKYFDKKHFDFMVHKYGLKVIMLGEQGFTHHDAHAYSTESFMQNFNYVSEGKQHHLVIDGFGNNQEVLSLYESSSHKLVLIKRIYGYNNSLGLLYQYATSFCGMKENQDEYKFLGYESMINKILSKYDIKILESHALAYTTRYWTDNIMKESKKPQALDYINLAKLKETKDNLHREFKKILVSNFDVANDSETARIIIGYFVQSCLEQTVVMILNHYKIENITCSGGCFMNVKLNNVILNTIKGNICVNPLAGDQGAAIGMFRYFTNTVFRYGDLCWGIRDKYENKLITDKYFNNIIIVNNDKDFVRVVSKLIKSDNIVNIIQGNMEFGPRALCNTTTLAAPTEENVRYINKVNKRNEVMPMAPVILEYNAELLMYKDKLNRVIGSNKFMIMAHDVEKLFVTGNRGVCHIKPDLEHFTCRPQIINEKSNSNIAKILEENKHMCLINTSFNTHGRPIIYSVQDAIDDFKKQRVHDNKNILSLVILEK